VVATAGGPAVRTMDLIFDIEVTPSACLRDPGPATCPMGEMVRVGLRNVPVTNVVTISARVVPDAPSDELARRWTAICGCEPSRLTRQGSSSCGSTCRAPTPGGCASRALAWT
jgi:hypothetical protein